MKPVRFQTTHRARFSEIDPYGHLNTVHYLEYFLDHRFTGLRGLGMDLRSLAQIPVAFYMKELNLTFQRSVRADEEFQITSWVDEWGASQCHVTCEMSNAKGERLAGCTFVLVCIDTVTKAPCRWPDDVKNRFFEAN